MGIKRKLSLLESKEFSLTKAPYRRSQAVQSRERRACQTPGVDTMIIVRQTQGHTYCKGVARDRTDKLSRLDLKSQLFCMIMGNYFISFVYKPRSRIAGMLRNVSIHFAQLLNQFTSCPKVKWPLFFSSCSSSLSSCSSSSFSSSSLAPCSVFILSYHYGSLSLPKAAFIQTEVWPISPNRKPHLT